MCGKSVIPKSRTYHELAQQYGTVRHLVEDAATNASVVPGATIHAFFTWRHERVLTPMKWGVRIDGALYNARADHLHYPTWQGLFATQRCVIPVSSFHEGGHDFAAPDGHPLLIAGLYGVTRAGVFRTAMLTTAAGPVVAAAHSRQPVLVPASLSDVWRWCETPDPSQQLQALTDWNTDAALTCLPAAA